MNIFCAESDKQTQRILQGGLTGHRLMFNQLPMQEIAEAPTNIEVLVVFVKSEVRMQLLELLPNLKFVATRSTGFDHIDVAACKERGVAVANVPEYGSVTVAEYTFALLLSLARRVVASSERVRIEGKFSPEGLTGAELAGKTMGVVGTGRIGCHVAMLAAAFGMKVLAFDPKPNLELPGKCEMRYVALDELLAAADVVSLHVPYSSRTHHLLSAEKLGLMKSTAFLVNTARGGLVDTVALAGRLRSGQLAGAALDVLEEENYLGEEWNLISSASMEPEQLRQLLADHQLLDLANVLITPHNAFNTTEALARILATTVENIIQFASGHPINIVS